MILAIKANREVQIKAAEKKAYVADGYKIVEEPRAVSTQEGKPQPKPAAKQSRTKRVRAK